MCHCFYLCSTMRSGMRVTCQLDNARVRGIHIVHVHAGHVEKYYQHDNLAHKMFQFSIKISI